MKFSLIFYLVSELNFTLDFLVAQPHADLFIFNGNDSSAHLYVVNGTVRLQIYQEGGLISWKKDINESILRYSWPNVVNGENMDLIHNETDIQGITFYEFVFLNPFMMVESDLCITENKKVLHELYVIVVVMSLMIYFVLWKFCK